MVVIRGVSGGGNLPGARANRTGTGGFRVSSGGGDAKEAGSASALGAAAAIGLLAVQEQGPAAERDARGFRRGEAMLEELKALQAELLAGRADTARLERLASLSEGVKPADPGLAEALAAIALRAKIELARRGQTG